MIIGQSVMKFTRLTLAILVALLLLLPLSYIQEVEAEHFPVVLGTSTSIESTATTSHTVSLPSDILSGELLIAIFGIHDGNEVDSSTITWPAGFTEFDSGTSGGAAPNQVSLAYRVADGTEGASVTVTTGTPAKYSAHNVYRISGFEPLSAHLPESSIAGFIGGISSVDPPLLTPTGGTGHYLWISAASYSDATKTISSAPSGYSGLIDTTNSISAALDLGSAVRALSASSENPGTFSLSGVSNRRVGITIAIYPQTPPTIDQSFSSREGGHNITYSEPLTATDPETDTLTWSLATNASFLALEQDNRSAWVNGTPLFADRDQSYFVNASVDDNAGGTDFLNWTLFINNTAPTITNKISVDQDRTFTAYSRSFLATDLNADSLIWTLETNATFLSIDSLNRTVFVNGTAALAGVFFVNVTVSDGTLIDFSNYTLVIFDEGVLTATQTITIWLFAILLLTLFVMGPVLRMWFLWMLAGIDGILFGLFVFSTLATFPLALIIMGFGGFLLVGGVLLTIAQGIEGAMSGRQR